ncbi:MAG: hypothetical protein F2693_17215 [Actinobacteria bacterium]|nr:hypothetical protein [Actinomycetota bacterium]
MSSVHAIQTGGARAPVGRDDQLRTAEQVLRTDSVQVVGMPGTGVTALVETVVRRRADAGHPVLRVPPSPWSPRPTTPLEQVGTLLSHTDSPTVVVDDAHLVPVPDLEALLAAVEGRGGRVVIGVHPGDLVDRDVVHLPGLPRDAVRRLLESALGHRPGLSEELLVAGLARVTRGHVSHLRALLEPEVLRALAGLAAREQDLDALRTPFADALATRTHATLADLDEDSRLAASIVAVAGPHAPGALLDAAAGIDQLARAREARLLERHGETHRYRHAAVRDLVRRSLPVDVLAEARWRLGVGAQATGLHHAPAGVF